MILKPLHDYIAVLPPAADSTRDGFDVAQSAQVRPKRGEVVAVGPGVFAKDTGVFIPITVSKGDIVMYTKNAGIEIEIEGIVYLFMRQEEAFLRL